jgi:serine/threonine protein kinase
LHLDENSEFQLSENTISSLFAQLLKALAHLHSLQIAHLDLKPDNLLISSDGTLRLADFGLAARTPCNRAAHTLLTCPPEIFKIRKAFVASDIWASGVILFLLLTRYFPFCVGSHETMGEFRDKVLCAEKSLPKILADADVSNSAHNLLTRLFDMNHKTRITAKQALEHAWFTNPCNKPKVHVEMLTKSVQHFKRCKYSLKSVVKATMIVARLSPPRSKK